MVVARTPAGVTTGRTATLPRKRMGAALLFRDSDDQILLVEPTYQDRWEVPGGPGSRLSCLNMVGR
jgi:hypothetical protein